MELGQREYMCSSSSHKFVGSEEESGWTKYLKDFSSSDNNDQQREKSSYSNGISPSMVSDAASPSYRHHATLSNIWAFNKEEVNLAFSTVSGQHFPKKLNVKQPRNKKYFLDHDLEDTASSPVNSPRVSLIKLMTKYFYFFISIKVVHSIELFVCLLLDGRNMYFFDSSCSNLYIFMARERFWALKFFFFSHFLQDIHILLKNHA
ncbi:OLC1v1025047C2 [Oldenlandia corymbosa var. corymbosa]|uniref:OLC1v1025047C2 n=1 Tax=Oldenlandia corymbosa var. corymbosa TaxID=529605 RepID=A0AAV1C5Y3_OLDCO|nr:OLC1v1025047C2 [Oldenlandia corymbosa var. corymbosa]